MSDLVEVGMLSVSQRWGELKELFWCDMERQLSAHAAKLLEMAMEAEVTEWTGAQRYERTKQRRVYRNGYRARTISCVGRRIRIRVPQTRDGFSSKLLGRYERRRAEVDAAITLLYVLGLSTRKVTRVLRDCFKVSLSAQTVSNIVSRLDEELRAARQAPIEDRYVALLADGFSVPIAGMPIAGSGKSGWTMLAVVGIDGAGAAEAVGFRLAPSESEVEWDALLTDLYNRGLKGRCLQLVCHDGAGGLALAAGTVWPRTGVGGRDRVAVCAQAALRVPQGDEHPKSS